MATNLEYVTSVEGDTVANFDMENIFTSEYDVYAINIAKIETQSNDYTWMRIINSSGVDTGTNYQYASRLMYDYTNYADVKSTGDSTMSYFQYFYSSNYDDGGGLWLYVYNPADTGSYTFFNYSQSSYANTVNYFYTFKGIYVHKVAEAVTGLRLGRTGNFNSIEANVYGVR